MDGKVKIRLSAQGTTLSVEVPEDKAMNVYRGLAEKLLIHAAVETTPEVVALKPDAELPDMAKIGDPVVKSDLPQTTESALEAPPEGYKGFLMIHCEHCGHVRAFCSKYTLSWYKCPACGEKTKLTGLVPVHINCECGRHSRYFTNITDPEMDVDCIDCGSPVAVEWNGKKKCYETMRRE